MSDLLPLICATLKEKVLQETQQELDTLKQELANIRQSSSQVQVIQGREDDDDDDDDEDNAVVYASADLRTGSYANNPRFWKVTFVPKASTCRLVDLQYVRVCVGGGFPILCLDSRRNVVFEGFLDNDEADSDTSKCLNFCFCPDATWFEVVIHGWPRTAWEDMVDEWDPEHAIQILVEEVASDYPNATVEFRSLLLLEKAYHGAVKRLVPKDKLMAARAERDQRGTGQYGTHYN